MEQPQLASALEAAWTALLPILPIWIFGAFVGFLLPRPKWTSRSATLLLSTPAVGSGFKWLAVVYHLVLVVRELWIRFTHPGTFRGLARACLSAACGNGWNFQWPAHSAAAAAATSKIMAAEASTERMDNWYVNDKDLAFFKYHAIEDGACEGASPWQLMMNKDIPGFVKYTSWRRTLPSGKTEYKSVTISPNATAREFSDLYLDDDFRRNWDGMVYHHEVLEHGDFSKRQQVVRWIRRFPFSFLSDREYVIARREFIEGDSIYACTKALAGHPRDNSGSSVVKMDVFWSMWKSRTVADPWGAGTPACETVLLHHEQFKIPENLARFAVKHGMWGFVKKLASTVPRYVEARRKRVEPAAEDPEAYGAGALPNPPLRAGLHHHHSDSVLSLASMGSCSSSSSLFGGSDCGSDDSASCRQGHAAARRRRVRNVAVVVVAGGLALALGARSSGSDEDHKCQRRRGSSCGGKSLRRHVSSHRLTDVPDVIDE